MTKTPDPTKDPEFQKVVQTFLTTKPKPHSPKAKRKKVSEDGAPKGQRHAKRSDAKRGGR